MEIQNLCLQNSIQSGKNSSWVGSKEGVTKGKIEQGKVFLTKAIIPPPCLFLSFLKIIKPGMLSSVFATTSDNQDSTIQIIS